MKACEALSNLLENEIIIPLCINNYNHHMDSVDITDELYSYNDTQLTSFYTWWPMLFFIYNATVSNPISYTRIYLRVLIPSYIRNFTCGAHGG